MCLSRITQVSVEHWERTLFSEMLCMVGFFEALITASCYKLLGKDNWVSAARVGRLLLRARAWLVTVSPSSLTGAAQLSAEAHLQQVSSRCAPGCLPVSAASAFLPPLALAEVSPLVHLFPWLYLFCERLHVLWLSV